MQGVKCKSVAWEEERTGMPLEARKARGVTGFAFWGGLMLCIMLAHLLGVHAEAKQAPKPVQSVLDLREWDFSSDGPVSLAGEWAIYWQRLVGPGDLVDQRGPEKTGYVEVPGAWNGVRVGGQELSGTGYGTYHLVVLVKNTSELMGLKFLTVGTAFSVWVNGRKVSSAGTVGTTPHASQPEWYPHVATFQDDNRRWDILLQVSNFHHRKGGVSADVRLGLAKDVTAERERGLALDLFLTGSIFIMAIYHLGLFALRRKDKAPLYFGFFCLLIALYTLLSGERYLVRVFPESSWALRVRLTNLTSFMSVPLFLFFLRSLFPAEFKRRILLFLGASLTVLSLFVLVTDAIFYTRLIPAYHVITLLAGLYSLYVLIAATAKKREGASVFLAGFSLFFLSIVNDVLYDHSMTQTGQLIGAGLFVFIFSQSFMLSLRFSSAYGLAEKRRKDLEVTNIAYQREISERREAQKALSASEEKYRLLAENVNDTIWIWDLIQGRYVYLSPSVKSLLGYPLEEAMTLSLERTLAPSSWAVAANIIQKELALDGTPGTDPSRSTLVEVELLRKDGSALWAEVKACFLRDDRGQAARILGVSRDITERKKAEQLLRAKAEADASNRAKSQFLATMSHELRTPLNHILGFTELVLDRNFGELNETQEEYLKDVLHSSNHLLSLINDILDLSKVEAGKLELNPSDIDLKSLLTNSLVMVREKALKHGIRLSAQIDGVPQVICADERKLKQIMYNLLSNAVKFTPDNGTITLGARHFSSVNRCPEDHQEPLPDQREYMEIFVQDSGIGIKGEDLERIFNPFEQVDSAMSRRYQGTGLGLSLTRQLVELHGGRIWAESEGEGEGSTFHFVMPVSQKEQPDLVDR
jgi:PAS domain S-box-containing protein